MGVTPLRKPKREPSETSIVSHARAALNQLPGVNFARNNVGGMHNASGQFVTFGLGAGSADLIGSVTVHVCVPCAPRNPFRNVTIARAVALEFKRPGKVNTPDQDAWAAQRRAIGWHVETVTSVEEAIAAVERARAL